MDSINSKDLQRYKNKSIPELIKIATRYFNKYIRERDKKEKCISCNGRPEQAGHYLSGGHNAVFRFDEWNVNGQCVRCNMYLSGNLINYRINLVKKIGEENVKWLEDNRSKPFKWDRFSLLEIILTYKNKKNNEKI